ncbi:MAG: ParB N-terminal domain-containing protein, partial [Alphaproteobacteria bacterium]|nr:ParB N-terminal domain-containing protein [Alphaproteobacteria bacterium]
MLTRGPTFGQSRLLSPCGHPANPRVHGKKQVGQIAASIKTFGFTTPLLIDRDNQVIAGHGRLLACRKLGITKVPTVRLDHLTPAQARALMIADNQLTKTPSGTTDCWRSSSRISRYSTSNSTSRSSALKWPRSICGSVRSTTFPSR